MRRSIAVFLVLVMVLSLCACQKKTTLKICVTSSGFGIAGDDFSGYEEYEIKDIKAGDCVYEYMGGELSTECRSKDITDDWLFKIESISKDGVTIVTHKDTQTLDFGATKFFASEFVAFDMPNYSYTISFTQ